MSDGAIVGTFLSSIGAVVSTGVTIAFAAGTTHRPPNFLGAFCASWAVIFFLLIIIACTNFSLRRR